MQLSWQSACLANMKPWVQYPACHKQGMVEHTCNTNIRQFEARGSRVHDQSQKEKKEGGRLILGVIYTAANLSNACPNKILLRHDKSALRLRGEHLIVLKQSNLTARSFLKLCNLYREQWFEPSVPKFLLTLAPTVSITSHALVICTAPLHSGTDFPKC